MKFRCSSIWIKEVFGGLYRLPLFSFDSKLKKGICLEMLTFVVYI